MYTVRLLDLSVEELKEVSALLQLTFRNKDLFSESFLRWQYQLNPDGRALGFNAYEQSGKLVAHYVTQPLKAKIFGVEAKGLLSLNTATHPDHVGKGLFTKLANETYAYAKTQGYQFVIGVANQNSTHGFINKLGFTLLGPLNAAVGPGSSFIRKQFQETNPTFDYERTWTKENLQWRLANPLTSYSIDKHGAHFCVHVSSGKPMIDALLGCFPISLLRDSAQVKTKSKMLHLWLSAGPALSFFDSGFLNIPDKLKPSPLNLIFKSLDATIGSPEFSKMKFSALDFDAY